MEGAEGAGTNEVNDAVGLGVAADHEGFHEEDGVCAGRFDDAGGLGEVHGERLLAKDVLAGVGGTDGPVAVVGMGRGDVDGVDRGVGEEGLIVAVGGGGVVGGRVFGGESDGAGGGAAGYGLEDAGAGGTEVGGEFGGDGAGSQEAPPEGELVHGREILRDCFGQDGDAVRKTLQNLAAVDSSRDIFFSECIFIHKYSCSPSCRCVDCVRRKHSMGNGTGGVQLADCGIAVLLRLVESALFVVDWGPDPVEFLEWTAGESGAIGAGAAFAGGGLWFGMLLSGRWRQIRWENLQVGVTIFVISLFKKMVFADGCAEFAVPLFDFSVAGNGLSAEHAWVAVLSYTFQLYLDFSGYSDMATA